MSTRLKLVCATLALAALGGLGLVITLPARPTGSAPLVQAASFGVPRFETENAGIYLADAQLVDRNGAPQTLENFEGQLRVINLWATWCAPCKQELPHLNALGKALGREGRVIAVSMDKGGVGKAAAQFEAMNLDRIAFLADPTGNWMFTLKATGLPLTLIVDGDGRELARVTGPAQWDDPAVIAKLRELGEGGR